MEMQSRRRELISAGRADEGAGGEKELETNFGAISSARLQLFIILLFTLP